MSGHNPHGHLSQPNSSWNPLQVPSYIPRQPQLAHMSNERPLVRSPLTWHTPTPPDALYSFISANHKNLELNPLLPSFVRGPPPFGSVDLTIQSARNSTTPSPRSLTSPPPEFPHNKQIPRSLTPNSLTNSSITPSPSVIQSTASIREKFQNSNGNNGELISPGNIFIRDARQINNEFKMATRESVEMVPATSEPVELVKEAAYQPTKTPLVPTSPKRMSPVRPPSVPNNNISTSPRPQSPLPSLPHASTPTEIINNTTTTTLGVVSLPQMSAAPTTTLSDSVVIPTIAPSPPLATPSTEDSIDSNGSKTRRKRKPNKTTRLSNDSDDNFPQKDCSLQPNTSNNDAQPPVLEKTEAIPIEDSLEDDVKIISDKENLPEISKEEEGESKLPESLCVESNDEEKTSALPPALDSSAEIPEIHMENDENTLKDENQGVIVNNIENSNESCLPTEDPNPSEIIEIPDEDVVEVNTKFEEENKEISNSDDASLNCFDSPRKRSKRKGDSDDIETIDKIAAMIAGSNVETNSGEPSLENSEENDAQSEKNEAQTSNSKINDLKEILETSFCTEENHNDEQIEHIKENCFEEVENKLEEMFAGIEDERPPPCLNLNAIELIDDQVSTNEVVSDLSLGNPLSDKTAEILFEDHKSINITQKRTHSNKHDQSPPKKKRKIVKKPSSGQKSSKSKSKSGSSSSSKVSKPEKPPIKEKIKEETPPESKYKGPFLQLKDDGSVNVINAPLNEDDVEKQNKVKKSIHNHKSDRNKIRGLHVSTLSMKYDADTTDASWMCVFCKRGPHKLGLGDLFGPYFVTTNCEEFELSQKNSIDDEFVSTRTKVDMYQKHPNGMPVVAATSAMSSSPLTSSNVKKKRKISDSPSTVKITQNNIELNDLYMGMNKTSETSYEVWLHEDCAVWASGVHLVGATIVGLDSAVWSSTKYKCSYCSNNGATMCCFHRGCSEKAHISCARTQNWTLDEQNFKSFCERHSVFVS